MLKKLLNDIETSFNILKFYLVQLQNENKKLKEQIKIFQKDIDEIIESKKL